MVQNADPKMNHGILCSRRLSTINQVFDDFLDFFTNYVVGTRPKLRLGWGCQHWNVWADMRLSIRHHFSCCADTFYSNTRNTVHFVAANNLISDTIAMILIEYLRVSNYSKRFMC